MPPGRPDEKSGNVKVINNDDENFMEQRLCTNHRQVLVFKTAGSVFLFVKLSCTITTAGGNLPRMLAKEKYSR